MSINDILKPKTKKEIESEFKKRSPHNLFRIAKKMQLEEPVLWFLKKSFIESASNEFILDIFIWAVHNDNYNIVKKLIDLKAVDNNLLKSNLKSADYNIAKLFMKNGIIPDINDFIDEISKMDEKKIKLYLNCKEFDPSEKSNIALSFADYIGNKNIVNVLLNDKRVKNKLSTEDIEKLFKKYSSIVKENLYIK